MKNGDVILGQCCVPLPEHEVEQHLYLILLKPHCVWRQKSLITVLNGQRQVSVEHLQVSLLTHRQSVVDRFINCYLNVAE